MRKTQKIFRNFVFSLAGLSAVALPLQLAASCGSSSDDTKPVITTPVVYDKSQRYSITRLNQEAATLPGENNIPWRRSASYEGLSQVFSFARAVAYELGWTDIDGGKKSKIAVLEDDNITKTPDEIRNLTGVSSTSVPNKVITDFATLLSSAQYSIQNLNHVKQASYLPIGDDYIEEPKSVRDVQNAGSMMRTYFGVDDSRFPYAAYQGADKGSGVETGDFSAGTLNRIVAWSDHKTPGQIKVSAETSKIARIITLSGAGYVYPVVEAKTFTEKYLPVFLELFNRLSTLNISAGGSSAIAGSSIRFFEFLKTSDFKSEAGIAKLQNIFSKLNNGSHHLLAIKAAAYGFDGTFASPTTNALYNFSSPQDWIDAPNNLPALLDVNQGVLTIRQLAAFARPAVKFSSISINGAYQSDVFGLFNADNSFKTPFLAFYTNTPDLPSLLTKLDIAPTPKIDAFKPFDLATPFSKTSLDLAASRVVDATDLTKTPNATLERDVPWRRSIGFEAVSQSFSMLRAVAYELNWTEYNAAVDSKTVLLDDADTTLTTRTNDNLRTTFNSTTTDEIINKYRGLVAKTTPFLESHRANSLLALGDDALSAFGKEDVLLSKYFNVDDTNFDYATYGGSNTKVMAWSDAKEPGTVHVKINSNEGVNKNVARVIKLPQVGYIYPVIQPQVFKLVYAPVLRKVFDRLISLDWSLAAATLSSDVLSMIAFLKNKVATDAASSGKIDNAISSINNGSHHLLAIVAGAKGFDSTLLGKDFVLSNYTRGSTGWDATITSLPSFLDTRQAATGYRFYANFARPGLGALKYEDDLTLSTSFVPYYTGLTTVAELLAKAKVK